MPENANENDILHRFFDNTARSFKVKHDAGAVGTTDEVTLTPVEAVDLIVQLTAYVKGRGLAEELAEAIDPCTERHWTEDKYGNEIRIDCGNDCEY